MNMFDNVINNLESSLNYATAKNRTITNNIANIDTPNFKAKDVMFKELLATEMKNSIAEKRTHEKHIPFETQNSQGYKVITKKGGIYNHNNNNVDIDKEMAELAKNQIYYQALVDRLNGKFGDIQTVIRGGG